MVVLNDVANVTTHGAADTVGANCVVRGIQPGDTQNPDFDHRGLLVNIDDLIILVRTTECERQSSAELAHWSCDERTQPHWCGRSFRRFAFLLLARFAGRVGSGAGGCTGLTVMIASSWRL